MKHAMLTIALWLSTMSPLASAVSSFELPWMNHETPGTLFNSATHKDGVFVVEAYFLGCSYCNQNAPNVNDLATSYENEPRVNVLDVGIDRNDSQYAEWIRRHRPNHPVLKDANRKLIGQLGTSGYPSTYVIDCKGKVNYQTSGVWNSTKKSAIKRAIDEALRRPCETDKP